MSLTKPISTLFLTLLLILASTLGHAQIQPSKVPMKTVVEAFSIPAGTFEAQDTQAILLTVTMNMEPDWYAYSNLPAEMGKPTSLTATTANKHPLEVFYPKGKEKPDTFDPTNTVDAYVSGTSLFTLIPGIDQSHFPVALKLDLLLCHPTKCLPVRLDLTFKRPDSPETLPAAKEQPWWPAFLKLSPLKNEYQPATTFTDSETTVVDWKFTPQYLQPGLEVTSLLSALLMGLLAGLILNIMPCVLPVVSLKLSALLNAGTGDKDDQKHAFREHNVFFVLGVLSFFIVLAVVLGATGKAWGALFQYRWLVFTLAGIMAALGLSLFGLFHLPVIDLKFGTGHTNPRKQAFFTGMLTTLLATPCSGPFLGGVLGWALIQGPLIIVTVFIAIGLGMSIPYIILILNPALARFLPKSGPWIEYVEKGIGFFLLGTAFYLAAIAVGNDSLRILAPLWVIIVGAWLWVRTQTAKLFSRWIIRLSVLVLLIGAILWTAPAKIETSPWEAFDPVELNERIGQEILFVDFTADWCPTCKVLEATVMTDENVNKWKNEYSIPFIKVDMTERDPDAEALLMALGSRSIPTAAIFMKGDKAGSPLVLRDLFTQEQLEKILKSL
ncbi:protein-disulfide reductase DsbD family protein [Pseudodesulfovibrio sediminis]|uniref:Thioredoxin domain-containing protein n=1 Tax=Pseudodesulfovibrio sediminis TaxID=2810563 RepID=A0ABM7P3G2_9BACT|nr:cytochrome c biogenesis protein CcdA [Pseudodesulfovibrio sediminis]BCS87383.1 hypothetical protein PSDVSF_06250 [Pseudodesulfovibrio sediminis]